LFAALNINPAGGFILFNVEPSVEHRYADAEAHWERFDGMMRAVTGHGVAVVLSLHPLCDPRDYAFAEQRYGVVLARSHKIYDLYPYCRLAVSYPCSTNVVSELFRKDLVLYDFSGLAAVGSAHASEFRLPWARVVNSFDEARAAIIDALREGAQTSVAVDKPAAASAMVRRYVDEISADRQLRSTSRGTRGRIDPVAACRSAQTSSLIGRVLDLLREKVVRPD